MTRRSTFYLAAAIFFLLLSLQPARASTWSTQLVDNSGTSTGKYCSMDVDASGKLYLGYMDSSGSTPVLKYATNAGGSWTTQSLKTVLPNATNASTSTVFTPGGPRLMAYSYNSSTGETKYQAARQLSGGGWQLQDVAGGKNPDGSSQPAMGTVNSGTQTGAVQYQGFTFITYSDGNTLWYANERDMYYYQFSGSVTRSDLAVDSGGNVHVVYYNATTQNLMYAKNPSSTSPAPSVLQAGSKTNPAIYVDANDTLHVVYLDTSTNNVMYTSKPASGGSWSTPYTVGAAGRSGGSYLSIKADSAGGLHVAYYYQSSAGTAGSLYYRQRTPAGSWLTAEHLTNAGGSSDFGQYATMALDQHNNVSIAYFDNGNSSLMVSSKVTGSIDASPPALLYGSVAQGASASQTVTVTNKGLGPLTMNGSVGLSGSNAAAFHVDANTCTSNLVLNPGSGSCAVTVRFSPTTQGDKSATLSIGSNDAVLASKSVALSGTTNPSVNYTIQASSGVGGTISPSGAVSAASGLNQSFTITPDPGYLVQSVLIDGVSYGALTSYTFSQLSANHTIQANFGAVVPVTTWSVAEVDNSTGSNTGKYCSMAVDDIGKLYLGYLDTTNTTAPTLKYTTNSGGSWSSPVAVPVPNVTSAGTATVFTPAGPRVMAYSYNVSTGARKYSAARLHLDSNSWELQDIAGGTNPDGSAQPPIYGTTTDTFTGALETGGYTFISYTDGQNLWYANERDMYYYEFEPQAPQTGAGRQSDLAMDSHGNIHIVYYNPTNGSHGRLMYGTNSTAQAANFQTSILVDETVSAPAITVDANDTLHVAYVDGGRVKYINKPAGGSWSAPYEIGPCGSSGGYTSIRANGLDIVHLAYYSNSGNNSGSMMYVQRMPAGYWTTPTQIPESNTTDYGQYAALVVDANHNVNIAYYDATRTSLKVATKLIPVISPSSASLSYPATAPGAQSSQTLTVSNAGQANLNIGTITLTGGNADQFALSANSCTGATLPPGGNCTLTVSFAPTATGSLSATLNIPSNDPYTANKTLPLQGSAVTGFYTINATASQGGTISPYGAVQVAAGSCQTFTMTPDSGFYNGDVQVNGTWMGSTAPSYTFCPTGASNTIYAWFDSPFRISGTSYYFGSMESAYLNALTGNTIQCQAVATLEDLLFNDNVSVSLSGGFDSSFNLQTGSTLARSLTVTNGTVDLQGMLFQ